MQIEEIAKLKAAGYIVEDMGEEWGPEFKGQYRWVLMQEGEMLCFDDGEASYNEVDAWIKARAQAQAQANWIKYVKPA